MGYAVQDVKSDELNKAGQRNVTGALAGKVAGVQINATGGQVGASSRIVIRGNSSFGDNQPLIVVDGVPIANDQYTAMDQSDESKVSAPKGTVDYGSGLNDINPEDIESVSILKGGSAALYGMRAGKGVILITTKSGKRKEKGIQINYDGNFSIDQIYDLMPMQNKYGQGYKGSEWDYKNAQGKGFTGSYQDYVLEKSFCYGDGIGSGVNENVDESWGPRLDAGLMIPQYNSPIVNGKRQATPWISHPDNIKDFTQLGYSMNHNVSIMSQTEKATTRASLAYRDQKGTLPNIDQKRYSAQLNTAMNISKQLEYNLSLNYTRTESDNLPSLGYSANNPFQSMNQWFGRQVDMKDLKAKWNTLDENGMHYNWNAMYHNNPFYTMNTNTNGYERNRLFGKTALVYKPLEYLKFEGRLGYDYYGTETMNVVAYNTDHVDGYFRHYNQNQTELNADFIAYFNKQFSDFSVNVLAGANYRNLNLARNTIGADKLTVPGLFTVSNIKGSPVTEMGHNWGRSNSVYAQGSVGYKSMAYIDVSARNDWDSTIEDNFFYPSVSASWIPTATFPSLQGSVLSFLKIRGGWAEIGSATDPYRTGAYYNASSTAIFGVAQFYIPSEFPPRNLRPESVRTTEVGVEANLFSSRLGIDVSYYNKTTSDQIMAVAISHATGYGSMLVNAGKVNNKGVELQLKGSVIKELNGWNWDLTLNWAKDKSNIIELYKDPVSGQEMKSLVMGEEWGTTVEAVPHESWGTIYGQGMKRNEKGQVEIGEDGLPLLEGRVKLGDVTPDWIGGFRSELSWNNFNFGFLLDFRKGGDIFSVSQMFATYTGILDFTAEGDLRERPIIVGQDVLKGEVCVTPDGKPNTLTTDAHSFFSSGYDNREMAVFDGSFLKLREMHLTYTVPQSALLRTRYIKAANVSLIGSNLATLWLHSSNVARIDPESGTTTNNNGVGLESGAVAPTRSFGIKLGLTF